MPWNPAREIRMPKDSKRYAKIVGRFLDKVDRSGECWVWTAFIDPQGYGRFTLRHGEKVYAHRFYYTIAKGHIRADLTIDHLCRTRACVRPSHLEVVTIRENCRRGESLPAKYRRSTHCKWGHPFDAENTYRRTNGNRACRTCTRIKQRRGRMGCGENGEQLNGGLNEVLGETGRILGGPES